MTALMILENAARTLRANYPGAAERCGLAATAETDAKQQATARERGNLEEVAA